MIFSLHFIIMVYHLYWFTYVEPSLCPGNISHSILVCNPFKVLLNSDCYYFIENFCVHLRYWPVIFFFLSCPYLDGLVLGHYWPCKMNMKLFPLLQFLARVWKGLVSIHLKCFIELTSKAIWFRTLLGGGFYYWFSLLTGNCCLQIFCFFLIQSWWVVYF